jgi:hypothetical protein
MDLDEVAGGFETSHEPGDGPRAPAAGHRVGYDEDPLSRHALMLLPLSV